MKNKPRKELILQISIIFVCLVMLAFQFPDKQIQAQLIACNGQPRLKSNPRTQAWAPGIDGLVKQISVVVFDHSGQNEPQNQSDFETINTGIQLWNTHSTTNCSNIRFKDAVRAGREYIPGENIPDETVYVIRPSNTQMVPEYRNRNTPQQSIRAVILRFQFPFQTNTPGEFRRLIAHELGHSFALLEEDMPRLRDRSIMGHAFIVTDCDKEAVRKVYCPAPSPTPTPSPNPTPSYCFFPVNYALYPSTGCPVGRVNQAGCCVCSRSDIFIQQCLQNEGDYDPDTCGCTGNCAPELGGCSPIVVDVLGNGFSLTNVQNGVVFDLAAAGNSGQCAWTAIDSDEAWLALDRNQNGLIDNGRELFGNVTAQVPQEGRERNGFLALAEYDKTMNGGNGDGVISNQDYIFSRLRLWQDANHDGISESNELKTLSESGLEKLELDYKESRKTDDFGNQFKYRAKVRDAHGAQFGRWAWDVFLVTEP